VTATLAGREFERVAIDIGFTTSPCSNETPSPPPSDWDQGWRKLVANVPAEEDLRDGHTTAASLLDPILNHEPPSGTWNPEIDEWRQA
jgi:hypothetical protein